MMSFRTRAAALPFRLAAAVAVLAAACSAGVAGADPAPAAAEGRTLVVMGDSFAANPSCDGVLVKCDGNKDADSHECLHRDTSWPVQLSALMNVPASDFENATCTNASIDSGPVTSTGKEVPGRDGYTLAQLALKASKNGAFGPRTQVVAIQLGANDEWPHDSATAADAPAQLRCAFNMSEGCNPDAVEQGRWPDLNSVTGPAYADRIRKVVEYVKYYAPNAKIQLVGYPELAPADSNVWCLDVMGVFRYVQPRAGAINQFWNRLNDAERDAAHLLSIDYVDARVPTAGHGLCSPDPWLLAALDPKVNLVGLPFHPTPRGDTAVAAEVYSHLATR
ncbi:SGNH/GDSL hydrolase family protein [Nocardia tengchongensis]|uniref:SGNH/GDSL hydrolase family protein n=3 Tax=Nocardia tengchongensis TaxID=2055889 RepID=A0ABX8CN37_9NOCA|nr:SGNH/GDSL hydrolase family protein [Nocardia tengchongensis]QVI21363.1 SGNH/GDSL hydrolase family protein [Nocardia tengchongensis]